MAVSGRESPSEQHYSLKWNDYSVKLVTAFQSLRDEEDFVDVTVACDGHQYSAHKMVLSACSPYFRAMLRANPCQHPIVILKDVGHNEMERLLEFMYNGEVNIAQDQLAAFLRTAENLKIRGLAGSSDDMEQIYNRDYGNISTSEKLYNQQQQLQQHNSTSVSAIATTNNSSGSQHNHQGIMSNNGFTKEEGDGGLSVTTADCYSPAPKKRKLVMLDNTEQDGIAEGDTALDGSGDANSVAALVTRAGPLGVEVKCLSRDLKAEPCETGSEAGLTGGGEAVYNSGGDDQTSHEQLMPSHLYSIGVSSSTGAAGGASHQDLGSAAQHNDQGGGRGGSDVPTSAKWRPLRSRRGSSRGRGRGRSKGGSGRGRGRGRVLVRMRGRGRSQCNPSAATSELDPRTWGVPPPPAGGVGECNSGLLYGPGGGGGFVEYPQDIMDVTMGGSAGEEEELGQGNQLQGDHKPVKVKNKFILKSPKRKKKQKENPGMSLLPLACKKEVRDGDESHHAADGFGLNNAPVNNCDDVKVENEYPDHEGNNPLSSPLSPEEFLASPLLNMIAAPFLEQRAAFSSLWGTGAPNPPEMRFTKTYLCPFCDKKFTNRQSRSRHVHVKHPTTLKGTCDTCGHVYTNLQTRCIHTRVKSQRIDVLESPDQEGEENQAGEGN